MSPEEFRIAIKAIHDSKIDNPETIHKQMDDLIIELLIKLGYEDGAGIFKSQEKWYA